MNKPSAVAEMIRAILLSAEYKQDLTEMSSYLASIKQERPIIHCLAKYLHRRGQVFQLEAKRRDLVVDNTHVEFKLSFDCDMDRLADHLEKYRDQPLPAMWADVAAHNLSESWGGMPGAYKDICIKKPGIFVWVICARDLSGVSPDALTRVCWSKQQCKWSAAHPYSDRSFLQAADEYLQRLQELRPCAIFKDEIATNGDFPSTYHLRICDFSKTGA
jgi:hypothetical protein